MDAKLAAALAEKAEQALRCIGADKPKTLDELTQKLVDDKIGSVVFVANPLKLVDINGINNGFNITVCLSEVEKEQLSLRRLGPKILSAAKKQADLLNAKIVYATATTDIGKQLLNHARKILSQEEHSSHFSSQLSQSLMLSSKDLNGRLSDVIKTLDKCGYLRINGEGPRAGVIYRMPTDLGMLCMLKLSAAYEEEVQKRMEKQSLNITDFKRDNFFTDLIDRMNDVITNVKMSCKDQLKALRIEKSAAALCKTDPHTQASELEAREQSIIQLCWSAGFCQPVGTYASKTDASEDSDASENSDADSDPPMPRRRCSYREAKRLKATGQSNDNFSLWLNTICENMHDMQIEDMLLLSKSLSPETMYAILALEKMGPYKPKTVKALNNALAPTCKYVYVTSPLYLGHASDSDGSIDFDEITVTNKKVVRFPLVPDKLYPENEDDSDRPSGTFSSTFVGRGRGKRKRSYEKHAKRSPAASRTQSKSSRLAQLQRKKFRELLSESIMHNYTNGSVLISADLQQTRRCLTNLETFLSSLPLQAVTRSPKRQDMEVDFSGDDKMSQKANAAVSKSITDPADLCYMDKSAFLRQLINCCIIQKNVGMEAVMAVMREKGIIAIANPENQILYKKPTTRRGFQWATADTGDNLAQDESQEIDAFLSLMGFGEEMEADSPRGRTQSRRDNQRYQRSNVPRRGGCKRTRWDTTQEQGRGRGKARRM